MKNYFLFILIIFSFLLSNGQDLERLTSPDVVPGVYGIVEVPETKGLYPSVLILHGSDGWNPAYLSLAKALSDSGFVALTIDLYAETGPPNLEDITLIDWPQRMETVRNAVTILRSHPSSKDQPVGIIGFSRGAHLAISVANQIPGISAVIDFFGAGGYGDSLKSQSMNFPPLLILHGDADTIVPVSNAYALQEAVLANGGEVEMYIYPHAGHAFNAPWFPGYSETAAKDSYIKSILFLNKWLKGNK